MVAGVVVELSGVADVWASWDDVGPVPMTRAISPFVSSGEGGSASRSEFRLLPPRRSSRSDIPRSVSLSSPCSWHLKAAYGTLTVPKSRVTTETELPSIDTFPVTWSSAVPGDTFTSR